VKSGMKTSISVLFLGLIISGAESVVSRNTQQMAGEILQRLQELKLQ
jgi:hypothetical protein